ncbi:aldehyde dehydrogenase family protein [Blastomonas sp. AAP53]|uniref:aldehyde dehydrogenase family protein n=1 Tax=Blastomonas sp. AAP53 TaxID=1248760 RepID=UPI0002EC5140|nr:aldehyde dehydrogenase family protein [Blastomonas sp. AAP53]
MTTRTEASAYCDGGYISLNSADRLPVYDPATGEAFDCAADADAADVDRVVAAAVRAHRDGRWRSLRPAERERILFRFAMLIDEHGEELAQLETREQGKSINVSRMLGAGAGAEWMQFAAGLATKISGRSFDTSLPGGPTHWTTFTRREPIGPVAGIVPWNFPTLIAIWKIAPALAAGCTLVLKPSETTPLTAFRLAELATQAGVPDGVFNVITGRGAVAGQALSVHPDIAKISFTGSIATGKRIGRLAMDRMARTTLELGGKNPAIIAADADLDKVVQGMGLGAFLNQGQVCASASRIFVDTTLYRPLTEMLEAMIQAMPVGPGSNPAATVNPLASRQHQARVRAFLADASAKGATLVAGARVPDTGFYVEPTLVLDPADDIDLARQEVFGPVLAITPVASLDEAVARANAGVTGLAASLWTSDLTTAMQTIPRIEAGTVWVNTHVLIDPAMPFGGYKQSGIGRDFGVDWLDPYLETKSVCIAH